MTSDDRAPEYDESIQRQPPGHAVLNETEARQAIPVGHMRYVLGISLALVIIAFAAIYLSFFRGA